MVRQTGLSPDTLRVWEQRYGVPRPVRSRGGHRLYSREDIAVLSWLVARQREGMRIAQAVDLWRELQTEPGAASADPYPEAATLAPLRDAWTAACESYDEAGAQAALAVAFALFPPESVCLDVLCAGLDQVQLARRGGRLPAQPERFASVLASRRVSALIDACPPPSRAGRIWLGCLPSEHDSFFALVLTYLLRARGWPALYFGPRIALSEFGRSGGAAPAPVSLVVLAAERLDAAADLLAASEQLCGVDTPVAYRGALFDRFPTLRGRVPAHFLGGSLEQAVSAIEELLTTGPRPPAAAPPSAEELAALEAFRECRAAIAARLWDDLKDDPAVWPWLEVATRRLGRDLAAALRLGALDVLPRGPRELAEQLELVDAPVDAVGTFLLGYAQAAEACLDGPGKPVLDWLRRWDR